MQPVIVTPETPLDLPARERGYNQFALYTKGPGGRSLQVNYDIVQTEQEWQSMVNATLGKMAVSLFMSGVAKRLHGDKYLFSLLPIEYLTKWVERELPMYFDMEKIARKARGVLMDASAIHLNVRSNEMVHFKFFDIPSPDEIKAPADEEDEERNSCPCCLQFVAERERFKWCNHCTHPIHVACLANCMIRTGRCPTCNTNMCMLNEKVHLVIAHARHAEETTQRVQMLERIEQQLMNIRTQDQQVQSG